jgi:hypothetical protein
MFHAMTDTGSFFSKKGTSPGCIRLLTCLGVASAKPKSCNDHGRDSTIVQIRIKSGTYYTPWPFGESIVDAGLTGRRDYLAL